MSENLNNLLRLISAENHFIISAVNGEETIVRAEEVFKLGVDSDFKNWNTDVKSRATKETNVKIYEVIASANFQQMFNPLSNDIDKLCLTQHQIINFCKINQTWFKQEGLKTAFLFTVNNNYYVVFVSAKECDLYIYLDIFENSYKWEVNNHICVVVPD
jgi:hypothetical protein